MLPNPSQPCLLDQFRDAARQRGHTDATSDVLAAWVRLFILFHDKQHPGTLGLPHVTHFLEHVVATEPDPLPALAMARAALALLFSAVLGIELGELPHPRPPKLLDQLRLVLRVRHYSPKTEECYVNWARRFILFHHKRHPRTMHAAEVEQFLTHLAVADRISASSQNQALNALLFFFTNVLDMDLGRLDAVRHRRGQRLPVVLSPDEVRRVLEGVTGADGLFRVMARLLYGCGLRVAECCSLRVHDLDLQRGQIVSIQVLLGHESLETTMIYTHVARRGVTAVASPLDLLGFAADEIQGAVAATQTLLPSPP